MIAALNRRSLAVRGRRILVLGLSYKKNTGDAREAPAREIIKRLLSLGADVHAVDPHVPPAQLIDGVELVELSEQELAAADLTLLVVDHDAFDREMVRAAAAHVLDCRHVLAGPNVETL